jgi:hypothetical protein
MEERVTVSANQRNGKGKTFDYVRGIVIEWVPR